MAPAALHVAQTIGQTKAKVGATPALGVPRLSVVIVNYRQWDKTGGVVRQLADSSAMRCGDAEVVVVDNHSPRHPLARKLRRWPGVSLRRWEKNHGFARAVNEGCRLSQGDWFLLLNPDTTLSEGFLEGAAALADRMTREEPRAGIVGFHLRDPEGTHQLSTGPFPSFWGTLAGLAWPRCRRKYYAPRSPDRSQAPWVTGCCLLLRRACWEALQGLDEDFFLYYEDVDLCLRAQQAGWSVWYDPNLVLVHHDPLHRRPLPTSLRLATRHSLMTYALKHWPRWQFHVLARLVGWEARCRGWLARWRGDQQQVTHFRELVHIARELRRRDPAAARARLDRTVQHLDVRLGV